MPYIYFGLRPRDRGATKLAVRTERGELEPVEPSRLKIFTGIRQLPMYSMMWSFIGLMVSILTYPRYTYTHIHRDGLLPKPVKKLLPFNGPGLAVVFKKGFRVYDEQTADLEKHDFGMMQFSGRIVWLKNEASKEDFIFADSLEGVDSTGPSPARYLNTGSFQAYLSLLSTATAISQFFVRLSQLEKGEWTGSISEIVKRSKLSGGWIMADSATKDVNVPMVTSTSPTFTEPGTFKCDLSGDRAYASMVYLSPGSSGISSSNSMVLYNDFSDHKDGFFKSGDDSELNSGGLIAKFNHKLALPDPNLIGDILGRHFLALLGDSYDEQFDNLNFLKSGLSALRLTRVGDELTHLFKCFDIASSGNISCVPFFNGSVYEGCVLQSPLTFKVSIAGDSVSSLSLESLKAEFREVSDHAIGLRKISLHFPKNDQASIRSVTSMFDLRRHCLSLPATQSVRDDILAAAGFLDFGLDFWVINPANLSAAFDLISESTTLAAHHPIARSVLFSRDIVAVALSCFGEKSAPSWDLPNGTECSLSSPLPPVPPQSRSGKNAHSATVNDASWVMVVRTTDLFSAAEDFRRMSKTGSYRSISSVLAKKTGHRVFSRDRMAEFWSEMRAAVATVNPDINYRVMGEAIKRKRESDEGEGPLGVGVQKKRRPGF